MAVSVDDLKPQPFKISVKGVEVTCSPLRLSHALMIARVGNTFQDPTQATTDQMRNAEREMDEIIAELIPELKDVRLDVAAVLEVVNQLMDHIQPADNKELKDKGVSFDTDPKA